MAAVGEWWRTVETERGRVRGVPAPAENATGVGRRLEGAHGAHGAGAGSPAGSPPVAAVPPVVAFRGIPYAASPTGALRFSPPRPHEGWTGVRDAARPGPAAPQGPSRLEGVMGARTPDWDEDGCLTLNVWSPADAADGTGRPVLLWLHGGGFTSGSGGWDWYDGARLAALGNLVVVTANYRLGPLGHLFLPDAGVHNLGLQDQAAALRWVHGNIAAFGGDPARITVGGQSAGAYSALCLAVAPQTRTLVRRVVAQSGPWGLPPQDPAAAAQNTADFLRLAGVPDKAAVSGNEAAALRELRALPVERLLSAYARLAADRARPGRVAPPLYPVLGGATLPVSPQQAVSQGDLGSTGLLIGTVRDEMTAFLAFDEQARRFTRDDVLKVMREESGGDFRSGGRDAAADAYDDLARLRPDAPPVGLLSEAATGWMFRDGTIRIAEQRAVQGTPAYVYRFDRAPEGDDGTLGATHCAELPFLFNTFDAYPESPMLGRTTTEDHLLAQTLGSALTTFATTGTPNGPGLANWRPYLGGPASEVMYFG
ncbi:carboxylesterase [Streptomyces sp. CB02923]|uniref:carboxylesterase/lipase family protein n=1 Tax=Streptomyces sp. CB02923 TaxID=1718985 RepID=UPI000939B0D4|nr:carboxylesterase family protein [Streptomyces sp. CB02923]OKI00921.1 carboxylesterase [Streptomyces sp. CB02923]